jgi:peptidoglycan/xylan/chitin deacetylase (PgdA/CDA1 family)
MIGRALALGAAAWIGWAWVPHLATPACTWRGPRTDRRLALTFDDGPDPEWTPRVLDVLGAAGVRATFFVIGERAARVPAVIARMAAEGHEVANHSWSHRNLWFCGPRATREQVQRGHDTIADLTGRPPRHFRPPWGMVNAAMFSAVRTTGERVVFWSIQPEGQRPAPAERQVVYVVDRAHPGAIVDLHDAEGTPRAPERLLDALPGMIGSLRERNYAFGTVADLLTS